MSKKEYMEQLRVVFEDSIKKDKYPKNMSGVIKAARRAKENDDKIEVSRSLGIGKEETTEVSFSSASGEMLMLTAIKNADSSVHYYLEMTDNLELCYENYFCEE